MTVAEDRQAERTGTSCPVCDAAAERGQLICLECGSRIALRHRRPPSWKLPVAIVVGVTALAAAGGVLAYEALDADAKREADAAPPRVADADGGGADSAESDDGNGAAASEDEPSLGAAPSGAEDEGSGSGSADPAETEAGEPGAADEPGAAGEPGATDDPAGAAPASELIPDGELFTWPRSLRGFTVVVQSTEDNASATSFARSVAQAGDRQVGVIASEDFRTIPEGFFVVFVGHYEDRPAAERAAARLGGTYPGAFPQAVRR